MKEKQIIGEAVIPLPDGSFEQVQIAKITETKTYKGQTTVKTYYTTSPIDKISFKADQIRLYLWKGIKADFEKVIKPLFEGKKVFVKGIDARKSVYQYDADLIFDHYCPCSYMDAEGQPYFYGQLKKVGRT